MLLYLFLKSPSLEKFFKEMGLSIDQVEWIIFGIIFLGLIIYGFSHYARQLKCPNCKHSKETKVIKTTITPENKKVTNYKIEKQIFLKCGNCNHNWSVFDEDYSSAD